MTHYTPGPAPGAYSAEYQERELREVAQALDGTLDLDPSYQVQRPREGMLRYFDATVYDPGSGSGLYLYLSGIWARLTTSTPQYTVLRQYASGTSYTIPGALLEARVIVVGGGGGSAGSPATGATDISIGGAGGAGGVVEKVFTRAELDAMATASVVSFAIGAAGAAGMAGGAAGAGGSTTFGTGGDLLTGGGGAGGVPTSTPSGPANQVAGAAGGTATGPADALAVRGSPSTAASGAYADGLHGPRGGESPYGAPGTPVVVGTVAPAGYGYGAGASGGVNNGGAGNTNGAAGQPGLLLIYETLS